MAKVYLSLGSNEGDRLSNINNALYSLSGNYSDILKRSSVYQTAAWGLKAQPDFLNVVVFITTSLSPAELLAGLQNIEINLNRIRTIKWGPRTIDIDILTYDNVIIKTPSLTIPHPLLQDRKFVLAPFAEIAPDYIHPKLHKAIKELYRDCQDFLEVRLYT